MPWVSGEDYDQQVERITADLFTKSATFRQTVVYREMFVLAAKGAAIIGIANVVALVGIWYGVYSFMEQTIGEKATKAVTEKNKAVDDSITELIKNAIVQTGRMQSQLDDAGKRLEKANSQVAETERQAGRLRGVQDELLHALKQITENRAFFNDPKNIDRLSGFVKLISESKSATTLADLRTAVNDISRQVSLTAASLERQRRLLEGDTPTLEALYPSVGLSEKVRSAQEVQRRLKTDIADLHERVTYIERRLPAMSSTSSSSDPVDRVPTPEDIKKIEKTLVIPPGQ